MGELIPLTRGQIGCAGCCGGVLGQGSRHQARCNVTTGDALAYIAPVLVGRQGRRSIAEPRNVGRDLACSAWRRGLRPRSTRNSSEDACFKEAKQEVGAGCGMRCEARTTGSGWSTTRHITLRAVLATCAFAGLDYGASRIRNAAGGRDGKQGGSKHTRFVRWRTGPTSHRHKLPVHLGDDRAPRSARMTKIPPTPTACRPGRVQRLVHRCPRWAVLRP